MFIRYLFFYLIILFTSVSVAHPVSFQGSKGIMGDHTPFMNHVQLNYSYRYWMAMGVHHFNRPSPLGAYYSDFASINFLIRRWNTESLQANIYAVLGLGQSKMLENSYGVALSQLQFDVEDRQFYFLTSYTSITSLKQVELKDAKARLGFAPYQGSFEDLHTWLLLEWRSMDMVQGQKNEDLTPFLRFFYRNVLFEIGQSFKGVTRFNYIIHF